MSMIVSVLLSMLCVLWPVAALAQDTGTVTREESISATATVRAIDKATRSVTLRMENGDEDTYTVGPAMQRFDQLAVGDTIKVTYQESLVLQLRKSGSASTPAGNAVGVDRMKSAVGGAAAVQLTRTVTVKSVDPSVPTITVSTEDGRTITRRVKDAKNLANVAPGDRIDITYTQALLVRAEPAK